MRRLRTEKLGDTGIRGFFVMSSTDLFFENRNLLGCQFFTKELQLGIRKWLEREAYWCIQMTEDDWKVGLDQFITDNLQYEETLDLYIRWLNRISYKRKVNIRDQFHGWRGSFYLMSNRSDIVFSSDNEVMHRICMDKYIELVFNFVKAINAFIKKIEPEWDCYPKNEERRQKNLTNKTKWDSIVYDKIVLTDEVNIDYALGICIEYAFFNDFIEFYTFNFSKEQKERYYCEFSRIAIANEFSPDYGMTLPLEALYEPEQEPTEMS